MKRFLRWLWHELKEDSAAEILDRDHGALVVEELLRERAQAIIAQTNVPTFDEAWGCASCGAIQGEPSSFRCCICGRSELLSLTAVLQGIVRSRPRVSRFRKVAR